MESSLRCRKVKVFLETADNSSCSRPRSIRLLLLVISLNNMLSATSHYSAIEGRFDRTE